jgi:hypothetical protein
MFFWEHGFRPTYPGVSAVPTGVEEISPANGVTKTDVTKEMLRAGYGLAAYDGTVKGMRGWNNTYRVEMQSIKLQDGRLEFNAYRTRAHKPFMKKVESIFCILLSLSLPNQIC